MLCELWKTVCSNPNPICLLVRFVKDRRPSISPNFNFLGQLQHFQGTLSKVAPGGDVLIQRLDNHLLSVNDSVNYTDTIQKTNHQADSVTSTSAEAKQAYNENFYHFNKTFQRNSLSDESGNKQVSLSGKLQNINLTLNQNQQQLQIPGVVQAPSPCEPVKPEAKPTLQLPAGSASLLEKRKSLTLSLTPVGICPPSTASISQRTRAATTLQTVCTGEMREGPEAKTKSNTSSCRQLEDTHWEQTPSHNKCSRNEVMEQSLLSPLSFTLNKLLGWGERVLLGGMFVQPVRMGQPAYSWSSGCLMCLFISVHVCQKEPNHTLGLSSIYVFIYCRAEYNPTWQQTWTQMSPVCYILTPVTLSFVRWSYFKRLLKMAQWLQKYLLMIKNCISTPSCFFLSKNPQFNNLF